MIHNPELGGGVAFPYLKYVALMTQVSPNAPTAIVLENTLSGPIVWTWLVGGVYYGTLAGAFPFDKTFLNVQCYPVMYDPTLGPEAYIALTWVSINEVALRVGDFGSGIDSYLTNQPIEIRVYP